MTTWTYVIAGYVVTIGGLASYAGWVMLRGRKLARQVPPKDRRWM